MSMPPEPPPTESSPPAVNPKIKEEIDKLVRQRQRILDRLQHISPAGSTSAPPERSPEPPPPSEAIEALKARIAALEAERAFFETRSSPPAEMVPTTSFDRNLFNRLHLLEQENTSLREALADAANNIESLPTPPPTQDDDRMDLEEELARRAARIAELEKQQEVLSERMQKVLQSGSNTGNRIDALEAELKERQQEVQHLKLDLADVIVDQKQGKKASEEISRQLREKEQELFQANALIKDLHAKLDTATRSNEDLQSQLTAALRHKSQLQEQVDRLETDLHDLREEFAARETERLGALQEAAELQGSLTREQSMRIRLEAAETREHDLVETLETLQNERDALKEKMNRLLIGVREYITPPAYQKAGEEILEPRTLAPYMPFCFPTRLPRQLRIQWKSTYRSRADQIVPPPRPDMESPKPAPLFAGFHLLSLTLKPVLDVPRSQLPPPPPGGVEDRPLPWRTLVVPEAVHPRGEFFLDRHQLPQHPAIALTQPIPIRAVRFRPTGHLSCPGRSFSIISYSFTLFLSYLATNVFRELARGFSELAPPAFDGQKRPRPGVFPRSPEKERTILPKVLAYETRPPLEFAIHCERTKEFLPTFKRGRLNVLLRSFESSITSIVEKFKPLLGDDNPQGRQD